MEKLKFWKPIGSWWHDEIGGLRGAWQQFTLTGEWGRAELEDREKRRALQAVQDHRATGEISLVEFQLYGFRDREEAVAEYLLAEGLIRHIEGERYEILDIES